MADVLGAFEQAVLLCLVARNRSWKEATGGILTEVQHRLGREVAAGAVYATLDRLEQKGLISSELEAGTAVRAGRPRRCYAIAPAGVRALNDAKAASERLYAGMRWPLRSPR